MNLSDYQKIESIVAGFEVNLVHRPEWDFRFVSSIGMNNMRIRCDDWEPFTHLTDAGPRKIPLRYTFSARKPYSSEDALQLDDHESRMRFDSIASSSSDLARIFSAISCEERLDMLRNLGRGPQCVKALAKDHSISENKASYHLGILKDAGLVRSVKSGRETYYEVSDIALIENLIDTASFINNR